MSLHVGPRLVSVVHADNSNRALVGRRSGRLNIEIGHPLTELRIQAPVQGRSQPLTEILRVAASQMVERLFELTTQRVALLLPQRRPLGRIQKGLPVGQASRPDFFLGLFSNAVNVLEGRGEHW